MLPQARFEEIDRIHGLFETGNTILSDESPATVRRRFLGFFLILELRAAPATIFEGKDDEDGGW